MNRADRRKLSKKGTVIQMPNKSGNLTEEELLNMPCTIKDVLRICEANVSDAIKNYHNNLNPMIISVSLQLEIIKKILIDSNLITEEKYNEIFKEKLDEFNADRKAILEEIEKSKKETADDTDAKVEMKAEDSEVTILKKEEVEGNESADL